MNILIYTYFFRTLPDDVVDDDGVWREEQVGETLRDLRELQSGAVKNLTGTKRRETICERSVPSTPAAKNISENAPIYPRRSGNEAANATWK